MGLPASLQPASVCPTSVGKQSRKASGCTCLRGRHGVLIDEMAISDGSGWRSVELPRTLGRSLENERFSERVFSWEGYTYLRLLLAKWW